MLHHLVRRLVTSTMFAICALALALVTNLAPLDTVPLTTTPSHQAVRAATPDKVSTELPQTHVVDPVP